MMATLAKIGEYCTASEEWPRYVKRLEFFLIANKVMDGDLKHATLLSVIGPCTFKLLRNLLTPDKLGDKSYAELVEVLTATSVQNLPRLYTVQSSIAVQEKSSIAVQGSQVNLSAFVAELRAIAEHCNFGPSFDAMIQNRVVCGINDDTTQKRLLAEGDN